MDETTLDSSIDDNSNEEPPIAINTGNGTEEEQKICFYCTCSIENEETAFNLGCKCSTSHIHPGCLQLIYCHSQLNNSCFKCPSRCGKEVSLNQMQRFLLKQQPNTSRVYTMLVSCANPFIRFYHFMNQRDINGVRRSSNFKLLLFLLFIVSSSILTYIKYSQEITLLKECHNQTILNQIMVNHFDDGDNNDNDCIDIVFHRSIFWTFMIISCLFEMLLTLRCFSLNLTSLDFISYFYYIFQITLLTIYFELGEYHKFMFASLVRVIIMLGCFIIFGLLYLQLLRKIQKNPQWSLCPSLDINNMAPLETGFDEEDEEIQTSSNNNNNNNNDFIVLQQTRYDTIYGLESGV